MHVGALNPILWPAQRQCLGETYPSPDDGCGSCICETADFENTLLDNGVSEYAEGEATKDASTWALPQRMEERCLRLMTQARGQPTLFIDMQEDPLIEIPLSGGSTGAAGDATGVESATATATGGATGTESATATATGGATGIESATATATGGATGLATGPPAMTQEERTVLYTQVLFTLNKNYQNLSDEMKEYRRKLHFLDVNMVSSGGADTGFDHGVGGKFGSTNTRSAYPHPISKRDKVMVHKIQKFDETAAVMRSTTMDLKNNMRKAGYRNLGDLDAALHALDYQFSKS